MTDGARDLADALIAVDDRGARIYDDAVARDVIALLALDVGRAVDLPQQLVELMGAAVLAAGLTGDEPPEVLIAKTRAHLEGRMPAPLKAVLARAQREHAGKGGDASAAARALLGVVDTKAPLGGGVRPAGTVAAGPLARFLVKE